VFSGEALTSDGGVAKEAVPAAVTTPFHLAIPVHDVHAAREFFGGYSSDTLFHIGTQFFHSVFFLGKKTLCYVCPHLHIICACHSRFIITKF
jgi:hypothetical protein